MSDNPLLKGKVPARYIGEMPIILSPLGRPYFDANGKPLKTLALRTGDTLYINEGEARGESWLHDPAREKESLRLGTGKRVLPEHARLSAEEHEALGYEFQGKSAIWEEITSSGRRVEQATQVAEPSQIATLSAMLEPQIAASGDLLKTEEETQAGGA